MPADSHRSERVFNAPLEEIADHDDYGFLMTTMMASLAAQLSVDIGDAPVIADANLFTPSVGGARAKSMNPSLSYLSLWYRLPD